MTTFRALIAGFVVAVVFVLLSPGVASAHPLGNFTVNQYSGLRVGTDAVLVDFVVDMAEIPAFRERSSVDTDDNGNLDPAERTAYASRSCAGYLRGLSLRVDGTATPLRVVSSTVDFPPGQAGLVTLRLSCALRAALAPGGDSLGIAYRNTNLADRLGWREITAIGDQMTLTRSSVPATSASARLTRYPGGLLKSPLDVRTATLTARRGGAAAAAAPRTGPSALLPRGVDGPTRAFSALIARRRFDLPFALLAVAVAGVLGAIHAAAPGHGKTVMAAYLLGERGSLRQAAVIGATVTVTHTAGVLALGVALTASSAFLPERLYPLLGLASGALVASVGISLGRRALRNRRAAAAVPDVHTHHDHGTHEHGTHDHHDHDHEPVAHSHGGRAHTHGPAEPGVGWKSLVTVGIAGGMVPSPSALVVLLGASALGRAWFGVVLVLAYGVGMAGTLTAAGLLLARARDALDRRSHWMPGVARFTAIAPLVAAFAVTALGVVLSSRALLELAA